MRFLELLALGKACLVEYEPRLKVLGQKPWSVSANDSLCWKYDGRLPLVTEKEMRGVIRGTLEQLAALDGFIMSGPQHAIEFEGVYQTISHNDLSLTFAEGYHIDLDQPTLRVNCWYYPAA
jgi:hypothetical protein